MFGSGKKQELESRIQSLKTEMEKLRKEKEDLGTQLSSAKKKISDLETQIRDTDLEALKEECRSTKAEYEGLKDLYNRKIQDFDASKEEKEQDFARQAAVERYNLDNEIRDNRQANQDYVSSTVRTFSESYNYYLNQIKMLMDALGDVAARTGESLFAQPNDDLKAKIGQQMSERLQAETEPLRKDSGDLLLIRAEAEPAHAEEAACCSGEAAEACEEVCEEAAEACEETAKAVEEAAETCEEAAEAVEDIVQEAPAEAEEVFQEAVAAAKEEFHETAEAAAEILQDNPEKAAEGALWND